MSGFLLLVSRFPDSNWGPSIYKIVALPTELKRHWGNGRTKLLLLYTSIFYSKLKSFLLIFFLYTFEHFVFVFFDV